MEIITFRFTFQRLSCTKNSCFRKPSFVESPQPRIRNSDSNKSRFSAIYLPYSHEKNVQTLKVLSCTVYTSKNLQEYYR